MSGKTTQQMTKDYWLSSGQGGSAAMDIGLSIIVVFIIIAIVAIRDK